MSGLAKFYAARDRLQRAHDDQRWIASVEALAPDDVAPVAPVVLATLPEFRERGA